MPLRLVTLPDNLLDFVNKNKPFPPVQRKQQQKYTENKGKGLQWNDFFWIGGSAPLSKNRSTRFQALLLFSLLKPYDVSTIRGAVS